MAKDPSKKVEGYRPGKGASVTIHVDLQDLCKKTVTLGPLAAVGEALLNLCLMANDHLSLSKGGKFRGSDLTPKHR